MDEREKEPDKKENFAAKLKRKSKELYDKGAKYVNGLQDKWDLGKSFDEKAEKLLDLSDGSELKAHVADGQKFLIRKTETVAYGHAYFLRGATYALSDRLAETEVPYGEEGHSETIPCFYVPYEIVVEPVGDRETALDILKRQIEGFEPNFLGMGKEARDRAVADFDEFARTVRSGQADVDKTDAFVRTLASFLPTAAALAARLLVKAE